MFYQQSKYYITFNNKINNEYYVSILGSWKMKNITYLQINNF